jgi:hypothetical protein
VKSPLFFTREELSCIEGALHGFEQHAEHPECAHKRELMYATVASIRQKIGALVCGETVAFDANEKVVIYYAIFASNLVHAPASTSESVLRKLEPLLPRERGRKNHEHN